MGRGETELMQDWIFGIDGAFIDGGKIDNESKTRRLIYKPSITTFWEFVLSLFGRSCKYPIDVPIDNIKRCDMFDKYRGQFKKVWVVIPWEGCKEIPMCKTVFGQIQMHMNKEVGELRDRLADLELKLHVKESEVTKLMAEKLQGRARQEKLKCSKESCDSTFTRNEAEALDYKCPACGSSINKD